MPMNTCKVEGCERTDVVSKGYCNKHRQRIRRHGDPLISQRITDHPAICTVAGCTKPYLNLGYCSTHYGRLKRHGDPFKKLIRDFGSGTITKGGYTMVKRHGKSVLLHRIRAMEALGRPLKPTEIIHHIDCDPSNNDPSNLEVMDQRTHTNLHSVIKAILKLNESGLRHINNHLRIHGLKVIVKAVSHRPSVPTSLVASRRRPTSVDGIK